jgi:hypothetical protein
MSLRRGPEVRVHSASPFNVPRWHTCVRVVYTHSLPCPEQTFIAPVIGNGAGAIKRFELPTALCDSCWCRVGCDMELESVRFMCGCLWVISVSTVFVLMDISLRIPTTFTNLVGRKVLTHAPSMGMSCGRLWLAIMYLRGRISTVRTF